MKTRSSLSNACAYVLEKGQIVHEAPMAQLAGDHAVRQQYLGV